MAAGSHRKRAEKSNRTSRTKRRLNCELVTAEERHRGIVLDLSEGGLFVQTTASFEPFQIVEVWLPAANGRSRFSVRARVARVRKVPPQLMRIVTGGVGLEVLEPPPEFLQLACRDRTAARSRSAAVSEPEADPEQGLPEFRVRVKQVGGVRSRTVTVHGRSEREAERAALAQVGSGWEVAALEPV